ncbi:MAG: sigma-54-dependent Fis family transcriptional regulator [Planctomycetales bacterium]|nr:sigma-54-dependent Fis family transcriptional regulator [Planctomycetales bacterium]
MPTLLVVDDERSILSVFQRIFDKSEDTDVLTASTAVDGLSIVREHHPDAVVLDVMLPDQSGLDVFAEIQAIDSRVPVIFITGGGTSGTAIEAMQHGALDYLSKPLDISQVRQIVTKAFRIRRAMVEAIEIDPAVPRDASPGDAMIGRCPGMQIVYKAIGRVAAQNVTVLIRGESGTGKELIARALYQHSDRAQGPFLAVNCAAIPENLLESELFGHERGAFTGADRKHIGKFEQCNGGTLFLDEIGDMAPQLQSKLLRILQEQRFERIGGTETVQTDVRVIAATNRNMEQMVRDSQFRGDLYYRLNGYTINLPPLRDRGDDLLLLIDHFLAAASQDLKTNVRGVAPETMAILRSYSWPGNIRELQSVIRQAVLDTTGPVLFPESLPQVVREQKSGGSVTSASAEDAWEEFILQRLDSNPDALYDETIEAVEKKLLSIVLRETNGNQGEASKLLGITRTTLRSKIKKLGIAIDRVVHSNDDLD